MKNKIGFMFLALTATAAVAGTVSAANWRDGLKVGQCKAHVTTTNSTCEVSFRGDNCSLPPISGASAPGGVCTTPKGTFAEGDDPMLMTKDQLPQEKTPS
jgi:hypothetical protein